MYEFMNNGPEPPAPYIGDFEIPNYHIFDIGGYGILQKDFKNLTLSGGLRYDLRSITGNQCTWLTITLRHRKKFRQGNLEPIRSSPHLAKPTPDFLEASAQLISCRT